jgi:hypothetical protein
VSYAEGQASTPRGTVGLDDYPSLSFGIALALAACPNPAGFA